MSKVPLPDPALDDLQDLEEDLALDGISELVAFDPDRIDGVAEPANGLPALLLKQAGRTPRRIRARLLKTAGEARFGPYVAYPAGRPDHARAADGYRDFASAAAVEAGA